MRIFIVLKKCMRNYTYNSFGTFFKDGVFKKCFYSYLDLDFIATKIFSTKFC